MRHLHEADVAAWVDETLLSPARTRPIVAVTSHARSDRGWFDPEQLENALGELAEVVFLETGEATWALTEILPPRLDVYGGALRIWWPGLTRDDDPYLHRLYFVYSPLEAERAEQLIVDAVRARSGRTPAGERAPPAAPAGEPERVRVAAMTTDEVVLASSTHRGPLREADLPLPLMIDALEDGSELTARPVQRLLDGRWSFSTRGLLPDPWQRFAEEARVGDVYTCRVQNLYEEKKLVFVDVLPGVVGVCHVSELDYMFVARLADFVQPGDLLAFKVLAFDLAQGHVHLSRKQALTEEPRALPSLVEGGRAFVWKPGLPTFVNLRRAERRGDQAAPLQVRERGPAPAPLPREPEANEPVHRDEELRQELEAANEDRRELRRRLGDTKKDLRSAEERLAAAERRMAGEDPLMSERSFLTAVRVSYARLFEEGDRREHPLQRMRVGREFLASVRGTPGIEVDKVVEVCTEIAAGIAHEKAGREVHPLRAGSRGADARTRAHDGARAWRCALQVNTPSARRLHWWNVPGPDGAAIEFACVCLHDHVDIPEA